MTKNNSRVWVEINLQQIKKNFQQIQKSVGNKKVMPILKANAYGLGAMPIANTLKDAGAFRIGLAEIKEVISLKQSTDLDLQIVGTLENNEIKTAISLNLICPITSYSIAQKISIESKKQKKITKCHLLIDTGMGRLGLPVIRAVSETIKIFELPNLYIEGVYTHFANANKPSHPLTKKQKKLFDNYLSHFPPEMFDLIHMSNSDAINNFPTFNGDFVRTGINLYGVFDDGKQAYKLKPTISLYSKVIEVRLLPKGHNIGYSCTHKLKKDTYVATIPAGYADGIPLLASNKGRVLIKGKSYPIIGRVSMDYITVDLGDKTTIKASDLVTLIGSSKKEKITVEELAKLKKTHPYDIICSLGPRVQRVYI